MSLTCSRSFPRGVACGGLHLLGLVFSGSTVKFLYSYVPNSNASFSAELKKIEVEA